MTYGKRRTRMSPMFPPAILTPTWLTSYIKRGNAPCFFVCFPLLQYMYIYYRHIRTYINIIFYCMYIKCIHIGTCVSCIISAHWNKVYIYIILVRFSSQCCLRVVSLEYPPYPKSYPFHEGKIKANKIHGCWWSRIPRATIFACDLLVFLLLGSNEATVRAVKIPGGLWFSMPRIRCLRVSVNGWRLLHKCKKCQVPRACGVVLFCFVVGNTMIVVMKWDPFWGESNKQLEWMVILEGFSLKVHCWGWQYRDPEKWGWFIYIPIWYGATVGVKLGSRPLACTFQFVFRGREAMLAPLLLC